MSVAPEKQAPTEMNESSFGVYIHWPFCVSKCPYCDFNSHVAAEAVDFDLWTNALIAELDAILVEQEQLSGNPVSVFFGGGTPSLMSPGSVAALLEFLAGRCGLDADVEISLEANPESVSAERLEDFRAAGVNRLSLGVQSLDDAALRALGRPHDAETALAAIRAGRKCFERFSFDLIYARPRQTISAWRRELARALAEDVGHLSLYQLTIEPDTPYARWHERGHLRMPAESEALAQLEISRELCSQANLPAYEISNHARIGEECRHNLLYWRYGFYVAVGPGAHGRLPGTRPGERIATEMIRDPAQWLDHVRRFGRGLASRETLSPDQQGDEMMLMGLRLREGVDLMRYDRLVSGGMDRERLESLVEEGLLWRTKERIGCTTRGLAVLDDILVQLLG